MWYIAIMQRIPFKYHILFWIGLIILGVAALSPYYMNLFKATMHRLVFLPVWLIATYGNLYVLLPKLWDKGKKIAYGFALSITILLLTILQRILCIEYFYPKFFWMRAPNADELNPFWIGPFVQFAAFIALPIILSIGLRAAWNWYQESYKAKQIIAEQQAAELSYLKAQVNPHFLFNTLNNLYGLSLESSKKVPSMILKLSDLLSYSLYESKVDSVSIEKELELIKDFIALEKIRYEDRVKVDLKINNEVDLNQRLAPLLMLPLVENAFKHGVKNTESLEPIVITLNKSKDQFCFEVENHFQTNPKQENSKGGIGLTNLRRRLDLHYPDKHHLTINKDQNKFNVNLKIDLNG